MPQDIITALNSGTQILINPFFDQSPPPVRQHPNDPQLFSAVGTRRYHLDLTPGQSRMGQALLGSIKTGNGPFTAPKFKWLPYVAGYVTYTALDMTVLTGKMSGCWLATFSLRGQQYVAHIGTDNFNVANTENVKNAWKIAVNARMITGPISAFNPIDHVQGGSNGIFGAVNRQGQCYAMSFDTGNSTMGFIVRQVRHVAAPSPSPKFL